MPGEQDYRYLLERQVLAKLRQAPLPSANSADKLLSLHNHWQTVYCKRVRTKGSAIMRCGPLTGVLYIACGLSVD